jgi:uncharacterized protein (TIGR03437 family)
MKLKTYAFFAAMCAAAAPVWAQSAETRFYRAIMTPQNEVPAITGLDARGTATIVAHAVRNAEGRIVSGSVDFHVNHRFAVSVGFTGLHIHSGAAGTNGPVRIDTRLAASEGLTANGPGAISRQAQVDPSNQAAVDALAGLFEDPSAYYVNLHTVTHPGGAIRGQLMPAEWTVVMGNMSPANEVPAITGLNASALGAVLTIITRDASGNITSGEVLFDVAYSFPSRVTFTGLHIHTGVAGVNGPVTLNSGMGRVDSADSGRGSVKFRNEIDVSNPAFAAALDGMFRNPAGHYINLHTTDHPGGAVRAQMRPTGYDAFPVNMLPSNEVPPVTSLDASAQAVMHLRTLRNEAGAAEALWFAFDVNYRFPGETDFTGLHIHEGAAGVNGPVRIDSGITGATSILSATGFGNIFLTGVVNAEAAMTTLNSLLASPESAYLNLHTRVNPGGAVRAQLAPARTARPVMGAVTSAVFDPALTTVAPGGLMSLYGANLTKQPTDLSGWSGVNVPTSMNGVSVTIGGKSAPLIFLSDSQINAQVPVDVTAATTGQPVVVRTASGESTPINATVNAEAPAIFITGSGDGIVVRNGDFSLIGADNPAVAGDILVVFSTGLGQTTPPIETGRVVEGIRNTAPVAVTMGGQPAAVIYSIASPGFIGLYQTAIRVPPGLAAGNQRLTLTINNRSSNAVTVRVR